LREILSLPSWESRVQIGTKFEDFYGGFKVEKPDLRIAPYLKNELIALFKNLKPLITIPNYLFLK
jgi:hypothetical protein